MRTMICHASPADKGPFRTVRCRKFATDERGATVPAVARYLRKGTRPLRHRIWAFETDAYMDDPKNSAYVSLGAVLSKDDSFRELLGTPAPCAYARNCETGRFESIDPPKPS